MFRKKWRGAAAGVALALLGSLVLSACGGSSGSSSTLTLGVITPATTFQAPDMNWGNESPYNQAVYDSLVQASPTGVIEPHLATAWSYNAARTVLTMTLRTGVKFTDGTPFNASIAVKNLEAFQKGTSNNASDLVNMASATAVSPTKLVIRLKQPDPAFLTYLGEAAGSQESPKAWSSPTAATVPVGSGPYLLDTQATVVGSSYVFTANPNYWDKPEQHYSKIVMNVYSTATTVLDAIEGGQVNAANTFDDTTIPQIQDAGFTVYPLQLNWAGLSLFDRNGTMSGPLGNVKVRQAINDAFDRAALLKDMSDGYGSVTTQVFPPNSPGYESSLNSYYSFDPAKAKQLLAEAGLPPWIHLEHAVDYHRVRRGYLRTDPGRARQHRHQGELHRLPGLADIYRDPRPEVPGHLLHAGRRPRSLAAGPVPADQGRHVQSLPLGESHGRRLSQHDADGFKLPGGGRGQGT